MKSMGGVERIAGVTVGWDDSESMILAAFDLQFISKSIISYRERSQPAV